MQPLYTYIHFIYNLNTPYILPIFTYIHLIHTYIQLSPPRYTLHTTYIHLYTPYLQPIDGFHSDVIKL